MKSVKRTLLVALFFLLTVSICSAQNIPQATNPEEVGLSKERLQRISTWIQSDVDKKVIPGAVVMVLRKGKIAYYEAFGYQDREKNIPMTRNSMFRIYSMTKPFTSLAVMMLAEEGKIQLPFPVSQYLPEFKEMKVGVERKDPAAENAELVLEKANREMTVQDLLRHTSGITYGTMGGKSMVKDLYNKAKLFDGNQTLAEEVTKLSKLPLAYQPGTTWDYSMSTDILARIVEIASGIDFDVFIADRITKPLGLKDTAYWAEGADRQSRIAEPGTKLTWIYQGTTKPKWTPGAQGLFSTAEDYARFCLMLLYGGTRDGVLFVSPKTIKYMTSNHIPPGYKYAAPIQSQILWPSPSMETGQGFGLGFAINCEPERSPLPGSKGDYYWMGTLGTYFWIDPKEELIGILMTQEPFAKGFISAYRMRYFVYQAISAN